MQDARLLSARKLTPADDPRNGQAARRLKVLVVEDDPDGAETLALILELYGFDVRVMPDGLTALDAAQADQPDVILLDLGLPGLDGHEVARRLTARAAWKRPFLIAVTGYGSDTDRRRSAQAGVDLHLVKPVDPEQLVGLLRKFRAIVLPEEAPPRVAV